MLFTRAGIKTQKNAPHDADSKNAELLVKGGFIKREMAGVYSYLPLGLKVLQKIKIIIREEMGNVDACEVLMPALTPLENWKKTGRDQVDIAYKPNEKTVLGWSHEEMVTPLAKEFLTSWKDLPLSLFQIQTKFRDEARAKSGILRGREFIMKDMYSFHQSQEGLDTYYERVKEAYFRVFQRCGLIAYSIEASGGEFSNDISHEFAVITNAGEDTMVFCKQCGWAQNTEISTQKGGKKCPHCAETLDEKKCVEVGNIFKLGKKYTEAFDVQVPNAEGTRETPVMGCYGIGVTRLMGTIVEAFHDENGICWPLPVAPYTVVIIPIGRKEEFETSLLEAKKLEKTLSEKGIDVLVDDRDESPGKKFGDADLLGFPIRVVISPKTLEKGEGEWKIRTEKESKNILLEKVGEEVLKIL